MSRTVVAGAGLCLGLAMIVASPRRAAGSSPEVRDVTQAYANALSACDVQALAGCTGDPLQRRLRVRLESSAPGQLGTFRRTEHEVELEPGTVLATLIWTRPDGGQEASFVTVQRQGERWIVVGGDVP